MTSYRILLVLALGLSGCRSRDDVQFRGSMLSSDARALYAPLFLGRETPLDSFDGSKIDRVCFKLTPDSADPIEKWLPEHQLFHDDVLTFFATNGSEPSACHYLNTRFMQLEPAEASVEWATDRVAADGCISIYRAIATGGNLFDRPIRREIFRYDFSIDEQGRPKPKGVLKVTNSAVDKALPLPVAAADMLVYVERPDDGDTHIVLKRVSDGKERHLIPNKAYQSSNPAIAKDGALIFSANPEGHYQLYRFSFDTAQIVPFEGTYPKPVANRMKVTSVYKNGAFLPEIRRIPNVLTLDQVCRITAAGNPEVNRLRALYVAALLEGRQARLAHLPELTTSFSYTSIVGVFLAEPTVAAGDYLAEHVARGLVGIVQPLFDFKRNEALHRVGKWRAKLAKEMIHDEINEQVTNATVLYFEIQYLRDQLKLNHQLILLTKARLDYYQERKKNRESTNLQIAAAKNQLVGRESEGAHLRRRYDYLANELKRVCGIEEEIAVDVADLRFDFSSFEMPDSNRSRELALLNHPRLQVVRSKLPELFNLRLAGPDIRPSGYYTDSYGQSRKHFTKAVDDYVNHSFVLRYPLASPTANRIHMDRWESLTNAYEIARQNQRRLVLNGLVESRMDLEAARHDLVAKQSTLSFRLEAVRVQRLYRKYGLADLEKAPKPLDLNEATVLYLEARLKRCRARRDLGIRFARFWRDVGLATSIPKRAHAYSQLQRKAQSASIWLWRTKEVIGSEQASQRFLQTVSDWGIRRVYAYVGSTGEYLKGKDGDCMERFIDLAASCEVECWGLMGEPEWMEEGNFDQAMKPLKSILAFNETLAQLPRLAGVKLDLEPHARAQWDTDDEYRSKMNEAYVQIVASLRTACPLPLWLDCPPKYFSKDDGALAKAVLPFCDGVTLMAYADDGRTIEKLARRSLRQTPVPMEVGIELSAKAPRAETLATLSNESVKHVIRQLKNTLMKHPKFRGTSIHDYDAINRKKR